MENNYYNAYDHRPKDKINDTLLQVKGSNRLSNPNVEKTGKSINILGIVMIVLLFASLLSFFAGNEPKTFAGFLDMLQNVPLIDMAWVSSTFRPIPDLGVFDAIRPFLNMIYSGFQFLAYIGTGVINAIPMVAYFVGWLFA